MKLFIKVSIACMSGAEAVWALSDYRIDDSTISPYQHQAFRQVKEGGGGGVGKLAAKRGE